MKKIILAFALCVASASLLNAQNSSRSNAIKVNIFSPIVKTGSFFYERKVSESSTAQLGVGFTAFSNSGIKLSGLFITPEYRFYLSNEAMNGFYVAPFLRYQNFSITEEGTTDKATLNTFGGGLVAGRQWMFKDRFTLDIFLGPSYNSGKLKVTSGNVDEEDIPAVDGFGIRTGVTFGIAF